MGAAPTHYQLDNKYNILVYIYIYIALSITSVTANGWGQDPSCSFQGYADEGAVCLWRFLNTSQALEGPVFLPRY